MGLLSRSLFTRLIAPYKTIAFVIHSVDRTGFLWDSIAFVDRRGSLSQSLFIPLIASYKLCHRPRRLETSNLCASIAIFPHIMSQNVTKCHTFLIYPDKIAATFSAICSSNCRASPVNTSNSSLSVPNRSEKSKSSGLSISDADITPRIERPPVILDFVNGYGFAKPRNINVLFVGKMSRQ